MNKIFMFGGQSTGAQSNNWLIEDQLIHVSIEELNTRLDIDAVDPTIYPLADKRLK